MTISLSQLLEESFQIAWEYLKRTGELGDGAATGGMLATARLTGQTIGAILAAISFRIAGHSETTALGVAAALAAIAAVASGARLYHPEGARPVKPAIVADAP